MKNFGNIMEKPFSEIWEGNELNEYRKILENGDIRPLDVKEGAQILFGKYSGTEITIDGEEMLVMREDDITAIITN